MYITTQNLIKMSLTVWRYYDFLTIKMAFVRHLGFVGQILGRTTKSIWWSLQYAEFVIVSVV